MKKLRPQHLTMEEETPSKINFVSNYMNLEIFHVIEQV